MWNEQSIKTENHLANFIVGELQADGWTCYEEVMLHRGGQIADIVAVRNSYIRVIETKMSASLALVEQAHYWSSYAHSVYVATYRWRGNVNGKMKGYSQIKGRWAFEHLCRNLGLGMLKVYEHQQGFGVKNTFQIDDAPGRFNRNIIKGLREVLCEEMLANGNAGTKGGGHWTPFKRTCSRLLEAVKKNPGMKLKDAIDSIDHHYSKDAVAVACLAQGIRDGIVPGIKIVSRSGRMFLYPDSEEYASEKDDSIQEQSVQLF